MDTHEQGAARGAGVPRRRVLAGLTVGLALLGAPPAHGDGLLPSPDGQSDLLPDDLAVRDTVAALADTVVPGPAGGADAAPGAVEAGAVDELYEPLYGLAGSFPALHADLLAATPLVLGRPARFTLSLPYRDRARVLENRITALRDGGRNPTFVAYAALGIVTWFCYYGVAQTEKGMRYIGFPPHSDGYAPDHTYGIRFRGMTRDGNPR